MSGLPLKRRGAQRSQRSPALHPPTLPFGNASLSSIACPASLIDARSHRIQAINAAACAAGLTLRKTCYACVHGQRQPCTHSGQPCPIDEVVRRGVPIQVQHEHLIAGGGRRMQNVWVLPLLNRAGEIAQVLHCCWDAAGETLLLPHRRPPAGLKPGADLTSRQRQVLRCLVEGLSNAELAEELCVSLPTAKYHVRNILKKLGVRNRAHACALAVQHDLVG
jgi:DNA-binding CsgD family transcriptional regulator